MVRVMVTIVYLSSRTSTARLGGKVLMRNDLNGVMFELCNSWEDMHFDSTVLAFSEYRVVIVVTSLALTVSRVMTCTPLTLRVRSAFTLRTCE